MKPLAPLLLALAAALPLPAAHQRIYMLGNSLTDDILYDGFAAIVNNGGHSLTQGSFRIPGAPINWLWNNPTGGFVHSPFNRYPEAFANYPWDVVTLQPFATYSNELQHARYFAQSLRGDVTFGPGIPQPGTPTGISPQAKIFIYAQWPGQMPDTWRSADWLAQTTTNVQRGAFYYESFVNDLRAAEPATTIRLIPAGHVFHEIYQLTRAGRIPGITRQGDLMEDSTHLNDRGSYVPALTFYSVIYGADPRGMVAPPLYQLTPEQATIIQNAVWKVVSRHPQTGITNGLVITTPSLPDWVEGQFKSHTLNAAQANGAVTWSLAPGSTLPPGLSLSSTGVLSGSVTTIGNYDFVARATDSGGGVSERDFILFVISANPPTAVTNLPVAPYGASFSMQIPHTGGVGDVTWSIVKNDLPHGLTLESNGRLQGTPLSIQGTFTPTVRLEDSIGGVSEAALPITVGPPEPATLIVGPTTTAPVINGTLNESLWSFPHTANRRIQGNVNNSVSFGVRHDATAVYFGIRVEDTVVRPADDAVHLFLDGFHDREAVYNADDRHFTIRPDGTISERNSRGSGVTAAAQIRAGGYDVEIRVPFSNLGRTPDGQSLSLGFDLGVADVDAPEGPSAYQVWLGTDRVAPTPATMGNLVLAAGPVTANLLVNPGFDSALNSLSFPGRATTARAGQGWNVDGVFSRPFGMIDNLGYGFPTRAIVASGQQRGTNAYQVIANHRAATGAGMLRFDVRMADADIAYRLFAYNGSDETVTSLMGTETQQHPARGGTPTATLLSGTLGSVPASLTWREVAIPVDFGAGYDYYVLAFSSPGGPDVPLESRIDNVQLGTLATQQSVPLSATPPSLSIQALQNAGAEGGAPLIFRITRSPAGPEAVAVNLSTGGSATAGADYLLPDPLFIPGRAATVEFSLAPIHDHVAEGTETLSLSLAAGTGYTVGSPSLASGTIADHPRDQWFFQNVAAGAIDWTADPDGDGVSNLLEYALGTNPLAPTSAPEAELAGDALTLAYLRARADVLYQVETSTDLAAWTTAGVNQDDAAVGEVAVASVPLQPATPRRFLRLRVQAP